jgi:hypothetical protein
MADAISLRLGIVKLLVGQPRVLLREGRCCEHIIVLYTTCRPPILITLTGCVERFPS